jgi:hypothetical protein
MTYLSFLFLGENGCRAGVVTVTDPKILKLLKVNDELHMLILYHSDLLAPLLQNHFYDHLPWY